MLLSSKNSRMLAPPPGLKIDSGSGSDSDEDSVGPMMLGGGPTKSMLTRQDTFYDINYEGVKISTVPQTKEGWEFFMDMLKTEHRKFKLLLTNLRIERMKILKEMEAFSNSFTEAKGLIKAQFETSMVDLRAVNVARLLNGEINKRSSSYIKTKSSPPKAAHKVVRAPKPMPSISAALSTVRETFGAIDEESDVDSGDQSVKLSTEAERASRPKVPLEYDVDSKIERRNKLRKKSMVPTFHVSTQTVEVHAVQVSRSSLAAGRLDKMRKDAMLVETLQSQTHVHPHTLAQPFLGYIRKHEKIYSREIGLMRIALREFKGIYDHVRAHLDNLMMLTCSANISPNLLHSLHQLQLLLSDGGWVFDSRFFIRKVQMNPLEDPIDVAAQANIISSYQEDYKDNDSQISEATSAGDSQKAAMLGEVRDEMNVLMGDLNGRVREKGGWRALLYTSNGTLDMNMPLHPWTPQEQVLILQEKLRHVQSKSAEKEKEHAAIVKQLQDTMEQAHNRDRRHSGIPKANRSHAAHPTHASHPSSHSAHPVTSAAHSPAKGPATGGRSMSVSAGSSSTPLLLSPLFNAKVGAGSNNQQDGQGTLQAPAAHRHTLAHVGKTSLPLGIASAQASHGGASTTAEQTNLIISPDVVRSGGQQTPKEETPATDDAQGASSGEGTPKPPASLPAEFSASMKQVIETLSTLYATLCAANHQQEQQQHLIVELQTQIQHQQQMLRHQGHRGAANAAQDDALFATVDGGSSVLSHASQEIIDEYQQLASGPNTPKAATHKTVGGAAGAVQSSAQHGGLTSQQVAAGTMGITGAGAEHKRRGSMLVQHRDGGQIEYVPIGKVGNTQNLRITVNNELRSHKHLLVRPASANSTVTSTPVKTFASIMAAGAGSKAPVDKYRQFEAGQRREKALRAHHGEVAPAPTLGGAMYPLVSASAKSEVSLRVPSMEPPSPKRTRKLSNNTLAHELSTIMDSIEGTSVGSSIHDKSDSSLKDGDAGAAQADTVYPHLGALPTTYDGSPEDLIKTLNTLCNKLQDSVVMHAASLKTGQEIMAGEREPSQVNDLLRSEYLPQDLHIGELAIDREKPIIRPKTHDSRGILNTQHGSPQKRPKTAGDAGGSLDSFEDIFHDMMAPPTATQQHSDVSIYATTLQNRYTHHVQEAKKLEAAIKKLGKANEQEVLEHQQEVAQSLYASSNIFRPQSAAPTSAPFGTSASNPALTEAGTGKTRCGQTQHKNRALSASSASGHHSNGPGPPAARKNRGVTAVPFAKVRLGSAGSLGADLDNISAFSPRLNEMSTELSNLSEHDVPVVNFRA